jgi:acetyl-CoA acetyltransferase
MAKKVLGRGAAIVGVGMSKFGAFPGQSSRDLFVEAFKELHSSVDKGFDPQSIEALYIGNYSSDLFEGQGHNAPFMADWTPAGDSGGGCLRQRRGRTAPGNSGDRLRHV